MPHQILTGPFAALEQRFLQTVRAQQSGNPLAPVSVLVGSNLLASHLKYYIVDLGHSVANLRFHTFLDLARSLSSANRPAQQKPRLPHHGASWILEEILEQTPAVFREVSRFAGFRDALLDTFRDLRDAGISSEDLDRAIAAMVESAPDRKEHLVGLGELFRRFRTQVQLFRDVDDDFHDAIRDARQAGEILGGYDLLVYGIYDVTGQQADLLGALANAVSMTYFIPYVSPTASSFARPFLESRERELGVTAESLPLEGKSDSLSLLASRVFEASGVGPGLTPDGTFGLVSVPGESRAAVEIVREILRAVDDGVIAGFHQAAVLCRQPQDQIPILAEALRLRGIPYYIHGGSPFSLRPLAKAVLSIASLKEDSFSRSSILKALELVAATLPESAAESWDVASWRVLTNHARFLAGVESWESGTKELVRLARRELLRARAAPDTPKEPFEEEAEERVLPVRQAEDRVRAAESLRSGWTKLRLAAADWPETLSWSDWAKFLETRLKFLELSEDWHAFSTALDDLSSLSALSATARLKNEIYRDKMVAALQESLRALSYPEGRFQRRGVNLLPLSTARGLRFPLIIVPGLEEGSFPSRLRQDPMLLDSERGKIGNPSRLPLKGQRGEEEKLLFDISVRSAEKRLILVTSRLDEESDRETIPSGFFLRAAAAARGKIINLRDLTQENVPGLRSVSLNNPVPQQESILVDDAEVRLRILDSTSQKAQALQALAREEPLRLARPLAFDRARWDKGLTGFDGLIQVPDLVEWIKERVGPAAGPVSASRLEAYAKCPYLFFLSRVIELEGWEEPEPAEGLDPLERGRVIHQILETFLRDVGEKFASTPLDDLQKQLRSQGQEALENNRPAGIPDLLWEIECDGLLRLLENWLVYERERLGSGLSPAYFEQSFGEFSPTDKLPPYEINTGKYTFRFRGRIDRIDLSRDRKRARVLDYKVGKLYQPLSSKKATALMAGEKMQLAVYRGALSLLPGLGDVESVEGEFLHLQPSDFRPTPRVFEAGELEAATDRLPRILEIVGEGLEGGIFFARTSGSMWPQGHCTYCDFLPVCGKDRVQREERKAGDARVARFQTIRQIDGGEETEE